MLQETDSLWEGGRSFELNQTTSGLLFLFDEKSKTYLLFLLSFKTLF